MSAPSLTGLSLVLGPANSGKLGRVLDWWEGRLDERPLIVVPTGPDARGLSAEMAQRAGALIGQSPAITFDGLMRLLLGRSPFYADDFERSLLISWLLRDKPPRAPGFSPRFPGTAAVVGSLLEQLGDSGRSPEQIDRSLERWASEDRASALLAADIQEIFVRYRHARDGLGLSDRSDMVREALGPAQGWQRPLALYGFTSFTLGQRQLIAELAGRTQVLLVFDFERSRGTGLTSQGELAWWEARAVERVELTAHALAYASPAVAYLERHFMDDGPLPDPPPARAGDGGVRFLLASGQRNEAELAAQQVVELIRSGVRPGDIALVARHMKTWGTLLEDVFLSCGIPCQVDERFVLDETGLGHAFLTGVRGVANDDPAGVLQQLRSPYSGLPLERVCDLELDYLRQPARGVEALELCARPPVRDRLRDLRRAVSGRGSRATVDLEAAQHLAGSMLRHALARSSPETAQGFADENADSRAFRALQSALSALEQHGQTGALPRGALRVDVLAPAIARMAVPGAALGSAQAVQVLTVHRARARRFQAVFVLGLVEGEFPGRADRPSLLTQAQRDCLDAAGGGLFSPETDQEEALFVRAVSRAWKHLFLSSRDADDGGGYAGQSYYWSHCKELLRVGGGDHLHRTLADQVFDPAAAPTPRQYLRACAARGLVPHPACGLSLIAAPHWAQPAGAARLVSEPVLAELAAVGSFSPSALESYLTCPFAWFVDRIVRVEDLETLVDDRLVGQLMHTALSDIYQKLRSVGALPLTAGDLPFAQAVAAEAIEALAAGNECPGTPAERRLTEHRLKRVAANLFAMEIAAGNSRTVSDTELEVGGEDGVDVGGLALRGRIDRVDETAGGDLFVIDYKSNSLPEKRQIGTADGLQLPLYMLALGAERPGRQVAGGMYLSPKKIQASGVLRAGCESAAGADRRACRVIEDDEVGGLLQDALALAREAAEGIRSGRIAPLRDRDCPGWCRLGPVCRARRGGKGHRR
jgi:RecB family exonuclease